MNNILKDIFPPRSRLLYYDVHITHFEEQEPNFDRSILSFMLNTR
jgi:hypothetical protein